MLHTCSYLGPFGLVIIFLLGEKLVSNVSLKFFAGLVVGACSSVNRPSPKSNKTSYTWKRSITFLERKEHCCVSTRFLVPGQSTQQGIGIIWILGILNTPLIYSQVKLQIFYEHFQCTRSHF